MLATFAFPADAELAGVLQHMAVLNPGIHYLLSGSRRNGTNHVVVACGGEIVHDPALDDSGIVGPMDNGFFYVEILVPLSLRKRP